MCKKITDLFKKKTEFPVIEQVKGELPSPRVAISNPASIDYEALANLLGIEGPLRWTSVANTNSMEPAIDVDHYLLCSSSPKYLSEETLKPGDVVIYKATWTSGQVIHAIRRVLRDKGGKWYCRTGSWQHGTPEDPQDILLSDIVDVAVLVIWTGAEDEP